MTAPSISVTISKDGTIAIPKKLRKALRLNNGQSVLLRQSGQTIIVEKTDSDSLRARARALVRQAKANVARNALTLTEEGVWARYDAVAAKLRKELQPKRTSKSKR